MAIFREIFERKPSVFQVPANRKSTLFLEALFYHVAVFKRALNKIQGFLKAGIIKPGSAMGCDLEVTLVDTRGYLETLSDTLAALQQMTGGPENPFKNDKFVGVNTPTAAPRELLLCMVWTQEFRNENKSALDAGKVLTEEELKKTLEQLSEYPSFKLFEPSTRFETDQIQKLKEEPTLSNGIPNRIFICVGSATASGTGEHLQHIKVGATTPMWTSGFPEFAEMCRSARIIRFGQVKSFEITKAVNALTAFEADSYQPALNTIEHEARGRDISKKALLTAKINPREHAIRCMRAGHPDFINHMQEIGQAYSGKTLKMRFACYCCQGIFGYSNIFKEGSQKEIRENLSCFERSTEVYDHQCAEAATSLQCKAENLLEVSTKPYHDSLPYA
ncbi:hypothetical protein MMC30_004991 [Trapelia coarctata]|nr:hypothetical protein [Trapelia coarctata]